MIRTIYEKWEEIDNIGKPIILEFFLSSKTHNKIYFGLDKDFNKTIYLEFDSCALNEYIPLKIKGMNISVSKCALIDSTKLYITMINETNAEEIFLAFASTLVENMMDSPSNEQSIIAFEETINFYKDYFANPNKKLSDVEEQGICGELYVLNELIEKKGEDVVRNWLGPAKNKRDFVFDETAIEVKTTLNQAETSITISNENQLYKGDLNELDLVVCVLEKNPNGDLDVIQCCHRVLEKLTKMTNVTNFRAKIISLGIDINGYRPRNSYTLISEKTYLIDDNFPALTKKNIPNVVFNVKYKINMNTLDKFLKKEE